LSENTLAKQIEVIGNPLIWPLPEFLPLLSPKKYLNPEKKHLLAVGRLHPQKQFDLLIRVFKRIAGDYKDWDLVILGDGEDRSMLECLVADLGLGESVSLPGVAGNLSEWYYKADAFVLSSAFEGFPNVLLEAMAHGIPVVSFDCNTGPRDLIEHGKNGLLVPDGDTAGLEQAIRELLSSEDFRNELGEHAKEVRQQYSIARIAGRWEKVFSGLWSG
jgi:glycosyltransferase involved in cell wall biosynthesis